MSVEIVLIVTLIIFIIRINTVSSIRYFTEKRLFLNCVVLLIIEFVAIIFLCLSIKESYPLFYQKLFLGTKFITSIVISILVRKELMRNRRVAWSVAVLAIIHIVLLILNSLNVYYYVLAVIASELVWQIQKPNSVILSNKAIKLYTTMSIIDKIRYATFIVIVYSFNDLNISLFFHIFVINYAISVICLINEIRIHKEISMNKDLSNAMINSNPLSVLSSVLSIDPSMILITDSKGMVTYVNHSFEENTGYSLNDLYGKSVKSLSSGNTKEDVYRSFKESIAVNNVWIGEFQNKKKSGEEYIDLTKIIRIADPDSNTSMYFSIKQDITFETQTMGELSFLANYDSMTGLLRRQRLDRLMSDKLEEFSGTHFNYYIAIVDIDKFKEINDEYGHLVGDEVIVDFAVKSRDVFRGNGFIGRFGGDEFIYFAYNISDDGVKDLFERLNFQTKLGVKKTKKRNKINYTISVGLTKGCDGEELSDVIARADSLLYRSKGADSKYLHFDF